jgi:hypothetical protein
MPQSNEDVELSQNFSQVLKSRGSAVQISKKVLSVLSSRKKEGVKNESLG